QCRHTFLQSITKATLRRTAIFRASVNTIIDAFHFRETSPPVSLCYPVTSSLEMSSAVNVLM
ncbi:hypothetical protein AMECASPLE_006911, partial [Ameca splendens]